MMQDPGYAKASYPLQDDPHLLGTQYAGHSPVPRAPEPRQRNALIVWCQELLALAVGLLAVVGIYAILAKYENSPLPNFPYSVSLNTFVSLLTQIFTMSVGHAVSEALAQGKWNWFAPRRHGGGRERQLSDYDVFNGAAQGAAGATKLLLMHPAILLRSVAAPGAVLVLALSAVSAFTQQLVHYDTRTVVFSNSSYHAGGGAGVPSMPLSAYYNAYSAGVILASKTPDMPLRGGFSNAVYNIASGTIANISASGCSTGNCTWPDYATLALCSRCVNSTADVKAKCTTDSSGRPSSCSYTLFSDGPRGDWMLSYGTYINASRTAATTGSAAVFNSTSSYGNELDRRAFLFPLYGEKAHAVTCSVYACVQTRRAAMAGGTLTDTLLASFPNASTDAAAVVAANKIFKNVTGTDVLGNVTLTPGPEDGAVFAPGAPSAGAYTVDYLSWQPMQTVVSGDLNGAGSGAVNEGSFSSDALQVVYGLYTDAVYNRTFSTVTGAMNATRLPILPGDAGGAVGYFYQELARSLTNVVRTDGASAGTTVVNGTALATVTTVGVTWAWLALPAAVLAAAIVLIVAVAAQTSFHRIDAFKSESLPALFIDIAPARAMPPGSAPQTADEMAEVAKNLRVRLVRGQAGELLLA